MYPSLFITHHPSFFFILHNEDMVSINYTIPLSPLQIKFKSHNRFIDLLAIPVSYDFRTRRGMLLILYVFRRPILAVYPFNSCYRGKADVRVRVRQRVVRVPREGAVLQPVPSVATDNDLAFFTPYSYHPSGNFIHILYHLSFSKRSK